MFIKLYVFRRTREVNNILKGNINYSGPDVIKKEAITCGIIGIPIPYSLKRMNVSSRYSNEVTSGDKLDRSFVVIDSNVPML